MKRGVKDFYPDLISHTPQAILGNVIKINLLHPLPLIPFIWMQNKLIINLTNDLFPFKYDQEIKCGIMRDMYALTHGLEYIMRYILRVILSNNGTRRSRVLLLDKMTRKIYLIMYERPCVNVFNARKRTFPLSLPTFYPLFTHFKHSTCCHEVSPLPKLSKTRSDIGSSVATSHDMKYCTLEQ